jgi:hypothetical protein
MLKLFAGAFIALTAACGSADSKSEPALDPAAAKQKAEWFQQYAKEQPQEAERYAQQCQREVGLDLTPSGAIRLIDCVEKKAKAPGAK